ncbi:MAG: fimbria major subunit, partial [Candidatus Cryptobacteroides sp.]|nr:fimbria major subunit [Candidatus Cryptobacteroides sp.]
STGVVFKAQITAGDGASEDIKAELASGKRIYVFNNTFYGTWDAVKKAATDKGAEATLAAAYNQAAASITESATEPTAKAAAAAGFTGYSREDDGNYYTYYYYWNRHNDNGKPYDMGIMEFAVVRNNVYKLCVESIAKFGHPTPPTDPTNPTDPDPDPVKPDDPDESVNYYFNVTVKVLPWTVRINNIEF